jgi:hypothetical protein
MTTQIHIMTLNNLKAAILKADKVYCQPRFGSVEDWIKISKKEALAFVDGLIASVSGLEDGGSEATPDHFEMFAGMFGSIEVDDRTGKKSVYLG